MATHSPTDASMPTLSSLNPVSAELAAAFAAANADLRAGRPDAAAAAYRAILDADVLPQDIVRFNLDLALDRLTRDSVRAVTKGGSHVPQREARTGAVNAFDFVERSFASHVAGERPVLPDQVPKVSVAVTSFNAEDTIVEAVESLLYQTYRNLEVIVCDDGSTDGTWPALLALQRRCSGLIVLRNNGNYGTYLSKNRALSVATGEIVLFQDSDDISHPARVEVQVAPLLSDPGLMATRTKYLRYDEGTGRIVPVAGLLSKYGLITLAVRRRAFEEIGFFDAVRKAGDDEWVQRLAHLYGTRSIAELDVTLYLARLREGSLVSDMLTFAGDGGSVDQSSSPVRRAYVEQFRRRFAEHAEPAYYRSAFPAFPLRPHGHYPDTVAALSGPSADVHVAICSIPSRVESLRRTVRSLEHQVDAIHLYLDKYDQVPDDLSGHSKIRITRSQDVTVDHRDNAKFLHFNQLKSTSAGPFYYLCCDDDIVYPHDYVHTMLRALGRYDDAVVVGLHGVLTEEHPRAYFRRRFAFHFSEDSLASDRSVNNLGTGTIAFHSKVIDRIEPEAWPHGGMVDIMFALECKRLGVPMVCVARHADWLVEFEAAKETPSLFQEFHAKERLIVDALRAGAPWGFAGIDQTLARLPQPLRDKLRPTLPVFHGAMEVGSCFQRLR